MTIKIEKWNAWQGLRYINWVKYDHFYAYHSKIKYSLVLGVFEIQFKEAV
jgi:hypothetical protein